MPSYFNASNLFLTESMFSCVNHVNFVQFIYLFIVCVEKKGIDLDD